MIIKKYLPFICALLGILLSSCHQSGSSDFKITRIIKNASNTNLSIEVYIQGQVDETIYISSLKADTVVGKCLTDNYGRLVGCSPSWEGEDVDSVLVRFEDSKIIRYCNDRKDNNLLSEVCWPNGKNIIFFPFDGGYQHHEKKRYLFEITEEDYEVATLVE